MEVGKLSRSVRVSEHKPDSLILKLMENVLGTQEIARKIVEEVERKE